MPVGEKKNIYIYMCVCVCVCIHTLIYAHKIDTLSRIHSNLILNVCDGKPSLLVLIDLCANSDTVDGAVLDDLCFIRCVTAHLLS